MLAICSAASTRNAVTTAGSRDQPLDPGAAHCRHDEVFIPAGAYRPFFKRGARTSAVPVAPICLSATPVTNQEYLSFVRERPQWRKSRVKALFAERSYLADWPDDLAPPSAQLSQPVTSVSWFAAGAYCEAHGGRLPTVAEWERVAGGDAPANATGTAGQSAATDSGTAPFSFAMGRKAADLADTPLVLAGIWEWTADFNSALVSGRIGTDEPADASLFCGDGFRAVDATNYSAFLRYSFRSSLRGDFALKNLGFRCAQEVP